MTTVEFENLTLRLEQMNRDRPASYRRRLAALAVAGYLYIGIILALLTAALVGVIATMFAMQRIHAVFLQLIFAVGALAWFVIRALCIRLEPPAGRILRPEEAPRLFTEVKTMQQQLQAPPIHEIRVTLDVNASISRVPRFGLLGWPQSYLVLGIPLLATMSPDEMRSVIAHEMGHHSKVHGRFTAWIYRIRTTWYTIYQALDASKHWGTVLFQAFFKWYAPYFGAWSFVLARAQEYEADQVAADLTSPQIAGNALLRLTTVDPYLATGYWNPLFQRSFHSPEPPASAFTSLAEFMRQGVPAELAQKSIAEGLLQQTGNADTHPSLTDRLRSLPATPQLPGPVSETAGTFYLGETFSMLLKEADAHWAATMTPHWEDVSRENREMRNRYEALRALESSTDPAQVFSSDDQYELATLCETYEGETAALPRYEAIVHRHPDHVGAAYAAGRLYLSQGDAAGVALLERAAEGNGLLGGEVCARIIAFYKTRNEGEKAKVYMDRFDAYQDVREKAVRERAQLQISDQVEPHALDKNAVAALVAQLHKQPAVREAWLARKKVQHLRESPLFILGVKPPSVWWKWRSAKKDAELAQTLAQALSFPGETFVLIESFQTAKLFKRIRKVTGSLIYKA